MGYNKDETGQTGTVFSGGSMVRTKGRRNRHKNSFLNFQKYMNTY